MARLPWRSEPYGAQAILPGRLDIGDPTAPPPGHPQINPVLDQTPLRALPSRSSSREWAHRGSLGLGFGELG
jgi:hypothetical protein